MSRIAIDCRKIIQVAAPLAGALLIAITMGRTPSQAQTNHMFYVPASDGYGFDDCLAGNKPCGRIIADAWCEAHGMSSSVSFGRTEDITASIPTSGSKTETKIAKADPGSFVVNCKD